MTVSTEVDHNDYTGNGVTTSFPYTFRIFKKSDLTVQVADLNENITVLTLDTDYSVTGAGTYSGGNVVLMSPLANGWQISISRDLPVTQETDLRNQGKFFAEVHEDAFDKLTMLIQQCFSFLRLALRKPSFIANYYDALNNRIRNLRDPSQAQDAATKNYVDGQIVDNTNAWKAGDAILDQKIDSNFARTLRVPESTVDQLSPVSVRKNSLLGWDSNGKPIPVFSMTDTADLAIKLASHEDGLGMSLLGMPGSGSLNQLIGKWTCPEAWGVITDSQPDAHANSKKMFNMFEWLRSLGGGVAYFTPGKTYWIDFIQFVPSNVVIIGYGATVKQINPLSMYGRGGFVFGSGREWNYQKAKAAYNSGNYPSSVADSTMAELPLKSYLRDNQSYVQCEKCKVYGLRMSAVFTDSSYWGGYAFNCVNAQHIRFFDVVGDGWTQLFNFGNDSSSSSPSCYDVIAKGATVEKADLVRTYYAFGFIANSTDCWIEDCDLLKPMTAGTINGSGAATNFVENCGFKDLRAA
ncbi:TPA: phage tail fiber protein, partial [Escherichia coli]